MEKVLYGGWWRRGSIVSFGSDPTLSAPAVQQKKQLSKNPDKVRKDRRQAGTFPSFQLSFSPLCL